MTGILAGALTGLKQSTLPLVTGGNYLAQDNNYYYSVFTSNGTFAVQDSTLLADVLMVAGGGGAAVTNINSFSGGVCSGSGAGGVSLNSSTALSPGSYNVVIGSGGSSSSIISSGYAVIGGTTSFTGLPSVTGGGGGYAGGSGANGVSGGSGSGATGQTSGGTTSWTGGSGISGQGFSGGSVTSKIAMAAGGGGSGENGGNATTTINGKGGNGTNAYASWLTAISSTIPGWKVTRNFTGTSGSSTIILTSSSLDQTKWAGIYIGMNISGTGIPSGTYITNIYYTTTGIPITLAENAPAGGTQMTATDASQITKGMVLEDAFRFNMVTSVVGNTINFDTPLFGDTSGSTQTFVNVYVQLSNTLTQSITDEPLVCSLDTYIAGGGGGSTPGTSETDGIAGLGGTSLSKKYRLFMLGDCLANSGSGANGMTNNSGNGNYATTNGASGLVVVRYPKTKIRQPFSYSEIAYVQPTTTAVNVTTFTSGTLDDGWFTLNLPFTTYFNNVAYNQIHIGTNSYATFGGGSSAYSGLSATNPAFPKIMVNAGDRGSTGIYYTSSASSWTMRYEGSTGRTGSPIGIIWELFCSSTNPKNIRLSIKQSDETGLSGAYSDSTLLLSFAGGVATKSYNLISG